MALVQILGERPSFSDYIIKKTPLPSFEEASFFEGITSVLKMSQLQIPLTIYKSLKWWHQKRSLGLNKNGNIKCFTRQCRLRSIINNVAFYLNVHSSLCACPDAVFSSADHRLWPSLMMSNSWLPLWPTGNAILHRFFYLYCHLRQASHLANVSIISVYVSFLLSQLEKHIYLSVLMGGTTYITRSLHLFIALWALLIGTFYSVNNFNIGFSLPFVIHVCKRLFTVWLREFVVSLPLYRLPQFFYYSKDRKCSLKLYLE